MDHVTPNCIAGASSPNKVVSFTVPAQALALSVRLSIKESHCKAKLGGAGALTLKRMIAQGLTLKVGVRNSNKRVGKALDVSSPAWPDSDWSFNYSGIKSTQGSKA